VGTFWGLGAAVVATAPPLRAVPASAVYAKGTGRHTDHLREPGRDAGGLVKGEHLLLTRRFVSRYSTPLYYVAGAVGRVAAEPEAPGLGLAVIYALDAVAALAVADLSDVHSPASRMTPIAW